MQIKFSNEKPAIYDRIKARFPHVDWDDGIAIAYQDTIYSKYAIPEDLLEHERVHIYQQKRSNLTSEEWVEKYLFDTQFRLECELEAYKVQINFLEKNMADRNALVRRKHQLYVDMVNFYDFGLSMSELKEKLSTIELF